MTIKNRRCKITMSMSKRISKKEIIVREIPWKLYENHNRCTSVKCSRITSISTRVVSKFYLVANEGTLIMMHRNASCRLYPCCESLAAFFSHSYSMRDTLARNACKRTLLIAASNMEYCVHAHIHLDHFHSIAFAKEYKFIMVNLILYIYMLLNPYARAYVRMCVCIHTINFLRFFLLHFLFIWKRTTCFYIFVLHTYKKIKFISRISGSK